jgi:hypothetical protein
MSTGFRRRRRPLCAAVTLALAGGPLGCGGSSAGPTGDDLPARPVAVSPTSGAVVTADRPTFTVRNARGFDVGQAQYTFQVTSGTRILTTVTVPAGAATTSVTPADALPRGVLLQWTATARGSAGEVSTDPVVFRLGVSCLPGGDPYAKSVVSWFLTACSLAQNVYNDPSEVLGPPNATGFGPFNYQGFFSLGEGGWVVVDMQACATDGPGADLRVFQAVGSEPVTVYAAGSPDGPFLLLASRVPCGQRIPGNQTVRYCDFDLAAAGVLEARYFKVEDGELYPCERAETPSEGADIDAVQILDRAGDSAGMAVARKP